MAVPPAALVAIVRRLNSSLRARLVIPIAALAVASSGVMAFTAIQLSIRNLHRASQERAALFSTLATDAVFAHMATYQHEDISDLLNALKVHRSDIDELALLSPPGLITASTEPQQRGSMPWTLEQLEKNEVLPLASSEFAIVRPLVSDNRCSACHEAAATVGYLQIRFNDDWSFAAARRLATSLALAAMPALALMIGLAWWLLGREAIGPIQRLLVAMHRAEAGSDVKADEGRPDEIGRATRGFDATHLALRKSQIELHKVYEERMVRADRFAMVGQMATGLAHEIKNPLAGLSGALELLADDLAHSPQQSEVVAEMRHQVKRLGSIMEGLLNFARPPAARLQAIDVNRPLQNALFLLGQQRAKQPVSIEQQLDNALPLVFADAAHLEQVFLNIGLNAFHAVSTNGGGTITVRTFARGHFVVAEVADTGPGIPLEVRPNIFTPFFTTRTNGTGLGLALSMRLVVQHGGKLEFDCPATGGTVFTVTLPTSKAEGLAG